MTLAALLLVATLPARAAGAGEPLEYPVGPVVVRIPGAEGRNLKGSSGCFWKSRRVGGVKCTSYECFNVVPAEPPQGYAAGHNARLLKQDKLGGFTRRRYKGQDRAKYGSEDDTWVTVTVGDQYVEFRHQLGQERSGPRGVCNAFHRDMRLFDALIDSLRLAPAGTGAAHDDEDGPKVNSSGSAPLLR